MNESLALHALLACLLVTAVSIDAVLAQTVYKWVDENGEVHYSQTLPPERVEQEHERLTGSGLLAEKVERAPTEQERRALAERLAREQDLAEQEKIRRQQDRLFLAAFPTEDALRRSIGSRRETIEAERQSVAEMVEQNRERFRELVERAAALERTGQEVPAHVAAQIENVRARLQALNSRVAEIDRRLETLDNELASELERHRRLTGSG
ncbi:MAG: DUF4124 domain-containing protein [Wenzhouxiangellaceae bacterium]|nr:DUF4124 domain-containing protein [Wenzhouxiangellaceae bacterium]